MDAYQSAHDDLAGCSWNRGRVNCLRRGLGGSGGLLDASDRGGLGSSATVSTATASILATVTDEIVERLVQVGRHLVGERDGKVVNWKRRSRDRNALSRSDAPLEKTALGESKRVGAKYNLYLVGSFSFGWSGKS
jgi:hypothetical protein